MDAILQNLNYIRSSVQNQTYKEQAAILSVMLSETILFVQDEQFKFTIKFSKAENQQHFYHYQNSVTRYKAKLLVDLKTIQVQFEQQKVNEQGMASQLDEMISTNLYTSYTQQIMNNWKGLANNKTYSESTYFG